MKKQLLSSIITLFSASSLFAQLPVSQTSDNKNVVLEEFTGIYCSFCPDGHKIAQAIKDANPNDVVLINIHAGSFANPNAGDPDFRTSFGNSIVGQTDLQGYPAGTVNRHLFSGFSQQGGNGTAQSRADWAQTSDTILSRSSYANIALEASLNVQTREITVDVEVYYTANGSVSNKLNIALLQNGLEGPQTGSAANPNQVLPNGNYEHNHMLRHLITGQWGDTISTTSQGTLIQRQYVYTVPADLNDIDYELGNLEIVAFLSEGQQEIVTGAEGPINFVIPSGISIVDLASSTNMQTPSDYCNGTVTPQLTVVNADTATINSYEVSYSVNGATPITQVISNPISGGVSITTMFPSITLLPGENKIEYNTNVLSGSSYIELVNGNNKSVSESIYVVPSTTFATTHQEGFEGVAVGSTIFSNAILENPNEENVFVASNAISSSVSQNLGGFGNSDKSLFWNFYSIPNGSAASIIFHKLDLTSGTGYGIKFNHAYAQYQSENDKLEVLVSKDCGLTWSSVFSKQGTALKTAPASTSNFFPAVTEWKNNFIDLSSYDGEAEVMISFKGTSRFGNNLFVDDIQLLDATTLSIKEGKSAFSSAIYPNPSNGTTSLELNLEKSAMVEVTVYNSLGEVVVQKITKELSSGISTLNLNLGHLNSGVYFTHVNVGGETKVKQISLLK